MCIRDRIFPACSARVGREVFTCTAVLDLKGLKLNSFTKDVREFISQIAAIDQARCPLATMLVCLLGVCMVPCKP